MKVSPETGLPLGEPVGQLPPLSWMTAPDTRAVFAALSANGAEPRFVGGCVRDAVLRRPVRDIDIATPDPPETVMALLAAASIRVIPTGVAHGTVTARLDGQSFEITTLRRDVETDGRHARVAFTSDWLADAARRDFTINALSCRIDGMVFDPHDGLVDLAAGRIRFIGEARQRIVEDVLRILRFFRFFAHYGRPPADESALAACRTEAFRLTSLSGERIATELFKLLLAPDPLPALLLMDSVKVLNTLLPGAGDFGRLRVLNFLEGRGVVRPGIAPDAIRRLAALLGLGASAGDIATRLKLSVAQTGRLCALASPRIRPAPEMGVKEARIWLHRLGVDRFRDLLLLHWAERRAIETHAHETAAWMELLDVVDAWTDAPLPISGRDVLALGVPPGPRVGEILAEMEAWWESVDFRLSGADAQQRLRKLIAPPT